MTGRPHRLRCPILETGRLRGGVLAACLGFALTLLPGSASAWHDDGHRIVGELAERNLSPSTRAKVLALLSVGLSEEAASSEGASLASAAIWADHEAREDPALAFAASSHYVNLDSALSPRELHAWCLSKAGCVATAVPYYADVLRCESASEEQRAEALRFLIHFVGDAHQPLHAGRSGDRGGNDIDELQILEYTQGDARTNLHAAWDGALIALTMGRRGWGWQRYADALAETITAEQRERWTSGTVYDWLEESRRIAWAEGYLHVDGQTPIASGDVLGEDWLARNAPTAELRLQQAGLRLAMMLEAIFAETA